MTKSKSISIYSLRYSKSASITTEAKNEVLKGIADIKGKLGFLLTLQANEVSGLFKAGKEFGPFLDECHAVAQSHPEILPGIFNGAEFERDYQLSKDLGSIASALNQLAEGIDHTLMAARSDALQGALEIYAAVKQSRDKVAGLGGVADKLAGFFSRTARAAANKS